MNTRPYEGATTRILDDSRGCLSVDLRDLELMPMQMQRMRIVRPVAERQPVAHAAAPTTLPTPTATEWADHGHPHFCGQDVSRQLDRLSLHFRLARYSAVSSLKG